MTSIAKVTVKHSGIKLNVSEQKGVIYFTDESHSISLCAPIGKIRFDSEGSVYYQQSRREQWAIELVEHDYSLLSIYVSKRKIEIKEHNKKMDLLLNSEIGMSVVSTIEDEE